MLRFGAMILGRCLRTSTFTGLNFIGDAANFLICMNAACLETLLVFESFNQVGVTECLISVMLETGVNKLGVEFVFGSSSKFKEKDIALSLSEYMKKLLLNECARNLIA
jgi:hypothetical protein